MQSSLGHTPGGFPATIQARASRSPAHQFLVEREDAELRGHIIYRTTCSIWNMITDGPTWARSIFVALDTCSDINALCDAPVKELCPAANRPQAGLLRPQVGELGGFFPSILFLSFGGPMSAHFARPR